MDQQKNLAPDIVQANYTECSEQDIRYEFSALEISEMKNEFFQIAAQKSLKENLVKSFKALLDSDNEHYMGAIEDLLKPVESKIDDIGLKNLLTRFKELMEKINKGYEIRRVMIYTLEDHEKGILSFYDEHGTHYGERRIAGRFQTNLIAVKKAASDE